PGSRRAVSSQVTNVISGHQRSEYGYRVDRRPRAFLDPQRRDDAEELPPAFLLARNGQVLEAEAVRVVQAHRADSDGVDRVGHPLALARDGLAVAVPADRGDAALVEQRHDRGVQARLGAGRLPGPLVQPLTGVPGAQE